MKDIQENSTETMRKQLMKDYSKVNLDELLIKRRSKRTMVRKVLLAVDSSKSGEEVFSWYLENLRKPDDEVHIVHCHNVAAHPLPTHFVTEPLDNDDDEGQKEVRSSYKASRKLLQDYSGRLKEEHVQFKAYLRAAVQNVGAEICLLTAQIKPSCLVVGSRGVNSIRKTLLGGTSDYVMHHSAVPVVVVKCTQN